VLAKKTIRAVVALAAETGKAGSAVCTKLILGTACTALVAFGTALGTFRASFSAIADPVGTANAQHARGAVQLIPCTIGTNAAIVADEIDTFGAVLLAHVADVAGRRITAAALFVTFTAFVKAVSAVVAHFVIIVAGTAVATVMFFVAIAIGSFAAVVAVITFPVVVTPFAAVIAFNAVLIGGVYRKLEKRQGKVINGF